MATRYDYEFYEPPSKEMECSICLEILKDPHITSCCGQHFCHKCITMVQSNSKPCPLCKTTNFSIFRDLSVSRKVNALKVVCCNRAKGCDWQGELGQFYKHLNLREGSEMGQGDFGCGYVMVDCTLKCGTRIERRKLRKHVESSCPHRTAEYQLSRLEKRLETSMAETAIKFEVLTVENTVLKEEIEELKAERNSTRDQVKLLEATLADTKVLLSTKCEALIAENRAIKVELRSVTQSLKHGADSRTTQLERNFTQMTVRDATLTKHSEIVDSLCAQNLALKEEVDQLTTKQKSTRKLLNELSQLCPKPPITISIHNYTRRARANDVYASKSFYSHQGGYKMALIIYPNGESKQRGTHLSVYMRLLAGEYDSSLRWPFKGTVTIQMLRANRTWDFEKTIILNESSNYGCTKLPVNGLSNQLWGFSEWVPKRELESDFLIGDAVSLRVTHVRVD